ncbi:MAG: adenylate/guanylate cyclase domain-containing protein [Candidatus Cloacimonetes bacterium]|nr:adenylate/guanylate cyclase domain-containing protein [Candidatus Cloacimonadota bacterium]
MKFKDKKLFFLNVIIFSVLVFSIYLLYDWIEVFEHKTIDNRFKMRCKLNQNLKFSDDIVFVNIDNYSKEKSGMAIWPKELYANLIDKISQYEPETIALDVFFGTTNDTLGNRSVINSVKESGNIIAPYIIKYSEDQISGAINIPSELYNAYSFDILPLVKSKDIICVERIVYSPLQEIVEFSAGMGFVNMQPDSDGVLRRIPIVANYNNRLILSFFFRSVCSYLNYPLENIEIVNRSKVVLKAFPMKKGKADITIPLDKNGNMLINYSGSVFDLKKSHSAWNLLINTNYQFDFKDKLVIVSDISSAQKDHLPTPFDEVLWNPYIFANAMNTVFSDGYLREFGIGSSIYIFILLLIFTILTLINLYLRNFMFNVISILLITFYIILNTLIFIFGNIILPFFPVLLPIFGLYLFTSLYKFFQSEKEIAILEGSLTSYLSPVLMDKFKKDRSKLKIGGERKYITVLFSDIVNFTGFCDEADPAAVQEVLKEYFEKGVDLVFHNNGIVDKYLGDGMLAFFENDDKTKPSQVSAVKCAIDFQKVAIELKEYFDKRMDFDFKIRIGIATGYAKVGNIGPEQKIDYTIIGSVVNLASRLEGVGNPGEITIDEWTKRELSEDIKCQDCGHQAIKGYKNPVKVYKIL